MGVFDTSLTLLAEIEVGTNGAFVENPADFLVTTIVACYIRMNNMGVLFFGQLGLRNGFTLDIAAHLLSNERNHLSDPFLDNLPKLSPLIHLLLLSFLRCHIFPFLALART